MKMLKRPRFPLARLLAASCLVVAYSLAPANAATAPRHAANARPDVIGDFRALAQQGPWECPAPAGAGDGSSWANGKAACAWQNRLRRQSWSWSDSTAASCISRQARWWNWAQAGLPPATPRSVWDGRWTAQALHMNVGDEQRLLVLRRDGQDGWQATEWRWSPNPRPATRRWQDGRWKLLLEAASQPQFRSAAVDTPDAVRMRPVFRQLLGARPGEMNAEGLVLEAGGLCLQASNPLPGQPKLHLSYSPNDSRLEQRAAMHLQLSRQYPSAKWLTQFKMLDMPAHLPSGAKFLSTWLEGGQVVSQLWMPVKGDTTTVRVRITTRLPRGQGDDMAAAAKVKPVVEHELEAIALQWAAAYE
jgi:hypothetical protein